MQDIQNIEMQDFLKDMVEPLLSWYQANKRDLPWRKNTDPYRVWVSEIMLQQTRVEAVKPYFENFIKKLPNVQCLAEVPEEELLKLWEGLGYYSRVRNMKKAAQKICDCFSGVFPQSYEEILSLPGIGQYTAGAIASIAYNQLIPAVDGNVLRVICRITEDGRELSNPELKKSVTEQLRKIYPKERAGDFTQALMELGAVICAPNGSPECADCPVQFMCRAFYSGSQMKFPVAAKKKARKIQKKTILLLCCKDKVAIRKRDEGGLLEGLWEFPNLEGFYSEGELETILKEMRVEFGKAVFCGEKKHIFTHIEWHMQGFLAFCKNESSQFTWVTKEQLNEEFALPAAFQKFKKYIAFADNDSVAQIQ